jgi:hypothetical protein
MCQGVVSQGRARVVFLNMLRRSCRMYQGVVSLPYEEGKAISEDWLRTVFLHVGQGKASEVELCRTSRLTRVD